MPTFEELNRELSGQPVEEPGLAGEPTTFADLDKSLMPTPAPTLGVKPIDAPEELYKGLRRGGLGLYESVVGTLPRMAGEVLGVETLTKFGKFEEAWAGAEMERFEKHPELQATLWESKGGVFLKRPAAWMAANVGEIMPSFAASVIPGAAAYKLTSIAKWGSKAIKFATALAAGVGGGSLEGLSLYDEMRDKGYSPNDAGARAALMTVGSGLLNAYQVSQLITPGMRSRMVHIIKSGAIEGFTEWLEEPLAGALVDRTKAEFIQRMKGSLDILLAAGVTGGIGGVAIRRVEAPVEPSPETAEGIVEEAEAAGYVGPDITAEEVAGEVVERAEAGLVETPSPGQIETERAATKLAEEPVEEEMREVREAPEPTPVGKEPWEMTQKEYLDIGKGFRPTSTPAELREMHKIMVRKALTDGKSVPARVLKRYPDLAKSGLAVMSSVQAQVGKLEGRNHDLELQITKLDNKYVEAAGEERKRLEKRIHKIEAEMQANTDEINTLQGRPPIKIVAPPITEARLTESDYRLAAEIQDERYRRELREMGWTKAEIEGHLFPRTRPTPATKEEHEAYLAGISREQADAFWKKQEELRAGEEIPGVEVVEETNVEDTLDPQERAAYDALISSGLVNEEGARRVVSITEKQTGSKKMGLAAGRIVRWAKVLEDKEISDRERAVTIGHEGFEVFLNMFGYGHPTVIKGLSVLARYQKVKKGETDEQYASRMKETFADQVGEAWADKALKGQKHKGLMNWLRVFYNEVRAVVRSAKMGELADVAETMVETLTTEKLADVGAHVKELGSMEAVLERYPDNTEVDKFARMRGEELYGPKEMSEDEIDGFLDAFDKEPEFRADPREEMEVLARHLNAAGVSREAAGRVLRLANQGQADEAEVLVDSMRKAETDEVAKRRMLLASLRLRRLRGLGVTFRAPEVEFRAEPTAADKEWAKGTKVIDARGDPLVVYHGTPRAGFWPFDTERGVSRVPGTYFTNKPAFAEAFTQGLRRDVAGARLGGPGIYPAYIRITRPALLDNLEAAQREAIQRAPARDITTYIKEVLMRRGFDGIINTLSPETTEYMVFKPDQIRSALAPQFRDPDAAFEIRQDAKSVREKIHDIWPMLHWLRSPEATAEALTTRDTNTLAEQKTFERYSMVTTGLVEADLKRGMATGFDAERFNTWRADLTLEQELQVRKAAEALYKRDKEALGKYDRDVQRAAVKVIEYFFWMRSTYRSFLKRMISKHLPGRLANAYDYMTENGLTPEQTVYAYENVSVAELTELHERYHAAATWGLDSYLPNFERGQYRLVDAETGTTKAVALTVADAKRKGKIVLEDNPGIKLTIESGMKLHDTVATRVSRGTYWRLVGKFKGMFSEFEVNARDIRGALRGNVSIEPAPKFAGPTIRRKGELKGEDNIFDVLYAYSYAMHSKVFLDPVLDDARGVLSSLGPNLRKSLQQQIDATKGVYGVENEMFDRLVEAATLTETDKGVMRIVKSLTSPVAERTKGAIATRYVAKARLMEGWLKLGYRPVAAMINWAGGNAHTWIKTGSTYMRAASAFLKTEEGKAFMERNEWALGVDLALDVQTEATLAKRRAPLWSPLGLFGYPEPQIRRLGIATNYLYAREKLGLDVTEAEKHARRALRFQNFTYNIAALPHILRSPAGRLVGQYKTYLIKEIEFILSLKGDEWVKYAGMQMVLGGMRGFSVVVKTFPLFYVLFGLADQDPDEWLDKLNLKLGFDVTRGLAGLAGADISVPATVQLPSDLREWTGPFLADVWKLFSVLFRKAEGEEMMGRDFAEWGKGLSPAMHYWGQLFDSVMSPDGWVRDRRGNKVYQPTLLDQMLYLPSGMAPVEYKEQQLLLRRLGKELETRRRNRAKAADRLIRHFLKNEDATEAINDLIVKYNLTEETIGRRMKDANLTPGQRILLQARVLDRPYVLEQWQLFGPDEGEL